MFGRRKELRVYDYTPEERASFNYAVITTEKGTMVIKLYVIRAFLQF